MDGSEDFYFTSVLKIKYLYDRDGREVYMEHFYENGTLSDLIEEISESETNYLSLEYARVIMNCTQRRIAEVEEQAQKKSLNFKEPIIKVSYPSSEKIIIEHNEVNKEPLVSYLPKYIFKAVQL